MKRRNRSVLRHQILYWVLDYQERPDSSLAGAYHSTNKDLVGHLTQVEDFERYIKALDGFLKP